MNNKYNVAELYRELHKIPEYGDKLPRTKALVCNVLDNIGISYTCFEEHDSIIAEITGAKEGKTVAIRADMDGLHVHEDTGLPFSSEHEGYMHACGHDAHTAIALCAAGKVYENRENLSGKVRFLFEAGEETGVGALHLLEENALDGVDAVFGLHTGTLAGRDVPSGKLVVLPGAVTAGKDSFLIEIKGVGGHGAYPSEAVDPIRIAANVITAIQSIVSMEIASGKGAVITFGSINGGMDNNSIPESVTLSGTIRTQSEEVRQYIKKRIEDISETIPKAFGTSGLCAVKRGSNPVLNNKALAEFAVDCISEALGEDKVVRNISKALMGSDDFARLAEKVPGVYFFLSTSNADKHTDFPNHNPKFMIDEDTLAVGVDATVSIIMNYSDYFSL